MDKHETPHARGKRMLKESGYHDDAAQDRALVKNMVKPSALKRARGGATVEGGRSKGRPDRKGRGPHTVVNVIAGRPGGGMAEAQMAHQAGMQQGVRVGAQLGARAAAQRLAGPPPGAAAPPGTGPGAPPPGAGAAPPPTMAADGGMIKVKAHTRRRAGGSVPMPEAD